MILLSVLLPAPFSPMRACTSPLFTRRLTPRTACTPPKLRLTSASSTWLAASGSEGASVILGPATHSARPLGGEVVCVVLSDDAAVGQLRDRVDGTGHGVVTDRLDERDHTKAPFGRRRLRHVAEDRTGLDERDAGRTRAV